MKKPPQMVSFSGGKDSTAMLLMMLERGERVDHIVFFDTGWEFPQMLDHIAEVERHISREITRLHPAKSFDYWMYEHRVTVARGPDKGKFRFVGSGWPSATRRWCTREKINSIERFWRITGKPVMCVGFAADETDRTGGPSMNRSGKEFRYPLIEWGITEADALLYCIGCGYRWGGLYEHFRRVSCFCCPLQRIGELRTLRREFPGLWQRLLDMDRRQPEHNPGFLRYKSVADLDRRFAEEERQPLFAETD